MTSDLLFSKRFQVDFLYGERTIPNTAITAPAIIENAVTNDGINSFFPAMLMSLVEIVIMIDKATETARVNNFNTKLPLAIAAKHPMLLLNGQV